MHVMTGGSMPQARCRLQRWLDRRGRAVPAPWVFQDVASARGAGDEHRHRCAATRTAFGLDGASAAVGSSAAAAGSESAAGRWCHSDGLQNFSALDPKT
jgi:hypothetical protein